LCKSKGKTVSIIELGDYIESTYGDGVARYQCANGKSPLNLALDATGVDMGNHSAPSAVVIVSDGLHMGQKEVAAAEALNTRFRSATGKRDEPSSSRLPRLAVATSSQQAS